MRTDDREKFESFLKEHLKNNNVLFRTRTEVVEIAAWAAWQQSALLAGKDGERLNWIQDNCCELGRNGWPASYIKISTIPIRQAIDAAMKATNQGET